MFYLAAAGLIMILAGMGAYYATGELSAFSLINVAAGPALLIGAGVVQARKVRGFSGALSRRVALTWGGVALAVTAAATLVTTLTNQWPATIDLTVERSYTLASQTHEVCAAIPPPTNGRAVELLFFEEAKLAGEVDLLVRAYQGACPNLRVRFLTAAEAPEAARVLLDRVEATLVACQGPRCEYVGFPSEENITNALLRLSRRGELAAYFLIGHGEVDLADEGDDGYSGLAEVLRAEGIEPRGWIGPASATVPERADLVIVAAPERNLLEPEIAALDAYLRGGGRLLALLEPGVRTNFDDLLERWGFRLEPGVLADRLHSPLIEDPSPISLLVHRFSPHPVVQDLNVRTMMLFPGARPVDAAHKPEPADQMHNIAFTSRGGWLESDVDAALGDLPIEVDADEIPDRELAVAATGRYPRGAHEARIVVIGDRDFVSNRMLSALYNRDLFMNAVWWLAEDERWVSIRPKLWTPDHYPVTIEETLSYFYFFAFALPEVLLLLGIAAWYRQRA